MFSHISFGWIHQFCHICLYLPTCMLVSSFIYQAWFTQLKGNHIIPPERALLLSFFWVLHPSLSLSNKKCFCKTISQTNVNNQEGLGPFTVTYFAPLYSKRLITIQIQRYLSSEKQLYQWFSHKLSLKSMSMLVFQTNLPMLFQFYF